MKKIVTIWMLLPWLTAAAAEDAGPVVEVRGDRTVIYPQRMALTGEETLMDVLEMYPDVMGAGFDELLTGSGLHDSYQLRLENVAVSGDTRLLVTQIKACLISKIQICDNAGVAKGRTGDGRVIDVNLLRAEEGVHGFLSLQGGTDGQLAPSANVRLGSRKTDIWSAVTYTRDDYKGGEDKVENLHFQMTSRFSPRDLLRTYVTQSAAVSDLTAGSSRLHVRNRSVMARLRYFHTFNELGTELLTMLSWAHHYTPGDTYDSSPATRRHEAARTNSPAWMLELNTPLCTKKLSLMAGYEGGIDNIRYSLDDETEPDNNERSRYRVMCNSLYLQLNCVAGPLLLTVGDRVMFYHYRRRGAPKEWTLNDTRNNLQASVVWTPRRGHQVQAAYYRKFRNPSAMSIDPLEEVKTDQYKLSYACSQPSFTGKLDGSIYSSEGSRAWAIDGAVYKKAGVLSLTAGFNVYSTRADDSERMTFANIRLAPVLYLPQSWRLSARVVWFSARSPYRSLNDNSAFYGGVQVDKRLGRHWSIHAEWHDMFCRQYSAVLGGIMYCL